MRAARTARAPFPRIGARVPGVVPRIVLGALGLALIPVALPPGILWVLGAALAVLAALRPRLLGAWALMLLLGVAWFWHGDAIDPRFFVLLAGLHLLGLLASQSLVLPVAGWVQLAVFRRPLVRYFAIQVPVQAAGVALLTVGTPSAPVAVAALAGAVGLVVLALVLVVPMLGERAREGDAGRG